tara:strand:- start:268 stop:612 length:345 start_codon:yes stop_codon:yes gene_type:complete
MYKFLKGNSLVLISIGAVPASVFRWNIDEFFIVNIIGCFLFGLINSLLIPRKYKLIFGVGFCGSFTTFSGWSFQLYESISQGLYKLFFFNLISIILFSLLAVVLGHLLAKKINA